MEGDWVGGLDDDLDGVVEGDIEGVVDGDFVGPDDGVDVGEPVGYGVQMERQICFIEFAQVWSWMPPGASNTELITAPQS